MRNAEPSRIMSLDEFVPLRPHFEGLTSDDEHVRLEASQAILTGLDGRSAETHQKVLDRLLKGLASGRKSARIGFSVTLTELLNSLFGHDRDDARETGITLAHVLSLLHSHTQSVGNVSGQEERDHHLGRLFGLEAVLKAVLLVQRETSKAEWIQVLDLIFDLARKKSWLREECGWIVYMALQESKKVAHGKAFSEAAVEKLSTSFIAASPEGVVIWLAARSLYPASILPKRPWHRQDPLHVKNSGTLAKIMGESSPAPGSGKDGEDQKSQQRGMWNSRPNFAWTVIFHHLYQNSSDKKRMNFASFWQIIVDENLFSASASPERKHWGFMLFSLVINEAPGQFVRDAFSKNMMRCLMNHLSSKDRYLHRTALKCLKVMQAEVDQAPQMADDFIAGLISSYGSPLFDQITKTKTVATLLARADDTAFERAVHQFSKTIQNPSSQDVKIALSHRLALTDALLSALRSRKLEGSGQWVTSTLKMLSKFGYLTPKDPALEPTPPFSAASSNAFRTKLSTCFVHLMSSKTGNRTIWPYVVVKFLKSEEESGLWSMSMELDRGIEKARRSAWKWMRRLEKMESSVGESEGMHIRALQLMYSLVMLQLYNGDSDALSILADLGALCDRMAENGEDLELLVDLLLSLLSKPSALSRKLAQQVFAVFSSDLTAASLQLLFDVLKSDETVVGQQDLFEQDDLSQDDDEATNGALANGKHLGGPSSAGDDVIMADIPDSSASGTNDEGDDLATDNSRSDEELEQHSSADSDDEASDPAEEDDETNRLNAALANLVGTKQYDQSMTKEDDTSDDEEEEMNDEEMFALDEQMATIFRERKKHSTKTSSQKQEKKNAKEMMTNFKNRVLDLLEIYIKQEHSNPLSLNMILPLLTLSRTSSSKQLSDRACHLIRDLTQRCKGNREVPGVSDVHIAWELLRSIHQGSMTTTGTTSRAHTAACSQSSLLVVKVIVGLDRANIKDVVRIYGETQTSWLLGKGRVQPSFFSDFVNWSTSFVAQQVK